MARTYTIAGNTVIVKKNSLNISDKLNERTTCSFVVIEPSFDITKGMDVVVKEDTQVIFAGKVFKLKSWGDKVKYVSVSCVDYSIMVDKRIIAEAYDNTLAGDIIRDFIAKYFSDEGIIEGNIADGPIISRAVFNYVDGNTAMNYICDVTGYFWEVDKDKKINFFDRATYAAPFYLTDTSKNYSNLQAEENTGKYRNRQIMRGPQGISTVQTRTFLGDGETQTFVLDLPVAKAPIVKVNGVQKTVGIRGLKEDENKEWFWQKNDKVISQNPSGVKLTSADTLTVEYQGYYPIIVVSENPGEINARKAIEGGSGIYENVIEEPNLDTQESALEYTNGLLKKYGFIPKIVTFNTHQHGLRAGQLISIQNTKHNLNGTFLIDAVAARDDGSLTLYSVKCLDGSSIGGWEKFYKELVRSGKKFTIKENEILVKLITFRDDFQLPAMEDDMTYILHQYPICGQVTCGTEVII